VKEAIWIARACKARSIRTVYHPLEYLFANEHASQTVDAVRRLTAAANLGIIIHDEDGIGGRG
jgi:hypothetical protein